ncbi:MAG: hypothetical protein ACRDOE_11330 [Streptosporangiaceae bacterium]
MAVVGEAVGPLLGQQAPGVRLHLEQHTPSIVDRAAEQFRAAEALWWHPMYERDPAHIWLRRVLAQAGQRIASRTAGQPAAAHRTDRAAARH